MSKTMVGQPLPMGFKFDGELSLIQNAKSAWEVELETKRRQGERNMKVLARRVFRTDEIEVSYQPFAPAVPTFAIGGELIAYGNGEFHLAEICHSCGKDWKLRKFSSLAGLGRVIAENDEDDDFVCKRCEWLEALAGAKKKS
jgi:hypothetical protein